MQRNDLFTDYNFFLIFFSIIFHVNVVIVLQLELKCCACDVSEVEVFAT